MRIKKNNVSEVNKRLVTCTEKDALVTPKSGHPGHSDPGVDRSRLVPQVYTAQDACRPSSTFRVTPRQKLPTTLTSGISTQRLPIAHTIPKREEDCERGRREGGRGYDNSIDDRLALTDDTPPRTAPRAARHIKVWQYRKQH